MNRTISHCQHCRHSVLDTFASLTGISLPSAKASRLRHAAPTLSRPLSTSIRLRSFPETHQPPQSHHDGFPAPASHPSAPEQIPWYLQVSTPTPPAPISPLLASQEIPPIPEDAPALLPLMLNHLSVQIGLDNLSLLDLRNLTPPPALGANLLMIIGTARSVKHLNVSADRFCRWLRSNYKLRPYADGLLGRNELKLKLRRKARKLKLARSVGNTVAMQAEGLDDGITTGWICVNTGVVEGVDVGGEVGTEMEQEMEVKARRKAQERPEEDEEEYDNPENDEYVGFGSRDMGTRVVVQMFTEEKRLEMDLEGLWDIRTTRRAKKDEKLDNEIGRRAEQEMEEEVRDTESEERRQQEHMKKREIGEQVEDVKKNQIEREIEESQKREGEDENKPMGGIGAS